VIVVTRIGAADGYEVQIPNAKAHLRGDEKKSVRLESEITGRREDGKGI